MKIDTSLKRFACKSDAIGCALFYADHRSVMKKKKNHSSLAGPDRLLSRTVCNNNCPRLNFSPVHSPALVRNAGRILAVLYLRHGHYRTLFFPSPSIFYLSSSSFIFFSLRSFFRFYYYTTLLRQAEPRSRQAVSEQHKRKHLCLRCFHCFSNGAKFISALSTAYAFYLCAGAILLNEFFRRVNEQDFRSGEI